MKRTKISIIVSLIALSTLTRSHAEETIRVGHFPNITHAQALVGLANGTFQKALGTTKIDVKTFTAGPSEIEALFAGALDLAYIGPGPAINGFVKSKGDLVVIAGGCSGGASLIVRGDQPIQSAQEFHNKRVASPQLGGTQDIALRTWLAKNGLAPVEKGGDVKVLPIANADQLSLFQQKRLDAAWAPEPWATRLVVEGGGKVFLDERTLWPEKKFATTVILVRKKYLEEHRDIVLQWLTAHVDVTQWIKKNPDLARLLINQEIKRISTKALPEAVIKEAMSRLELTIDPMTASLIENAHAAYALGFLGRSKPELTGLVDLKPISEVLLTRRLPPIQS